MNEKFRSKKPAKYIGAESLFRNRLEKGHY